ncbi:MAG: siroheme synthase [Rhodospirillaceae bacterium]|nr:siroheme synthase [Rhodospirillaceae bacterium]
MTRKRRYLPITFSVAGKGVGVVGNGTAALAKLGLLTGTEARVTLYSPKPGFDLAAATSGIDRVGRYPDARDLAETALLFLATENEAEDERLAGLARVLGVAVNVVDRPHLSDFAMPAIVDRGAITVAIASDGSAPVLAQRVRALIDALLPATLANLGDLARAIRSTVLERLPGSVARRRFWWRVFDGTAGAAALSGDLDRASALALRDLDAATERPPGKVFVITAPEAADLLTLRAQRLMLCTDAIVHDRGLSAGILAIARRDARRFPAGDSVGTLLIRLARSGQHVVRLAAGSTAGEVEALHLAGIDYEIVPHVAAEPLATSSSLAA